jgi:superfamily II DNA or RNA helicase
MAIMIIENFIKSGLGRVIVIAHHTNIIKSNFIDRLVAINPNFTFSDTDTSVDCFVAIRSTSINKIDTSQFNLLIVDEAHQNYFAKTVQSITCCVNHQVLLTATPSKFVQAGGFDILPIARLDIPNDFFANLSFRVVNAETSITDDSYNADNVIKSNVKFHRAEVKSMVDSVVPFIGDKKKLFICKDIQQAKSTALYLTSIGYPSYVSDSKSDPDSLIADSFKSGVINSLVVVDRMRVGYSDNDLYHTIDMSFTHNPDVIMQILSRSNRGNQSQSKTYIKVTNNTLNVRTRFMLAVAVSLFRADNLIAYNGLSTANLQVPVIKNSTVTRNNVGSSDNWFMPDNIDVIDFFNNCDFVDSSSVLRALGNYAHYTYDYCLTIAKNYSSWSDICNYESGVRAWLVNNGLRDQFISDAGFVMPREVSRSYKMSEITPDVCFGSASKCSDYSEFRSKYRTVCIYATNNGILENLIASNGNFLYKPSHTCDCCNTTFRSKSYQASYCSVECKKAIRYERVKAQRAEQKINDGKRKW